MTAAAALSLVPPLPDAPRPRRLVAVRTIELPLRPPPPPGQLCLFADEPPVVRAPVVDVPPPAPASRRVRLPVLQARLPLRINGFAESRGACQIEQSICEREECDHHLGATRAFKGRPFACAIAVANAYPHGLPPVHVARLLGLDEGLVQRVEYRTVQGLQRRASDDLDDWTEW